MKRTVYTWDGFVCYYPRLLRNLLIKHELEDITGCIPVAYDEYYEIMIGKEVLLRDFYDEECIKFLVVEPQPLETVELEKEFFLENAFMFKGVSDESKLFEKKIGKKILEFYILINFGSCYSYSCCASSVLRYKIQTTNLKNQLP